MIDRYELLEFENIIKSLTGTDRIKMMRVVLTNR